MLKDTLQTGLKKTNQQKFSIEKVIKKKGEKKKDILLLGKGLTQGLEHRLTAEKLCSIIFTKENKKFCLSLHYNSK